MTSLPSGPDEGYDDDVSKTEWEKDLLPFRLHEVVLYRLRAETAHAAPAVPSAVFTESSFLTSASFSGCIFGRLRLRLIISPLWLRMFATSSPCVSPISYPSGIGASFAGVDTVVWIEDAAFEVGVVLAVTRLHAVLRSRRGSRVVIVVFVARIHRSVGTRWVFLKILRICPVRIFWILW